MAVDGGDGTVPLPGLRRRVSGALAGAMVCGALAVAIMMLPAVGTSGTGPRDGRGAAGDRALLRTVQMDTTAKARKLGPPNFAGFCKFTEQGSLRYDPRLKASAYSCSEPSHLGLDVHTVCGWTYGGRITTRITRVNDARTWECWFTPNGKVGRLDFAEYCARSGQRAVLVARNAGGWRCGTAKISGDAACQALYPKYRGAFSRFESYSKPDSWECWA